MKQLRGKKVKKYFKDFPKRPQKISLILENIQYAKNVANMFRTAESAGVEKVYLTGISRRPPFGKDLQKVSRWAEHKVAYEYFEKTLDLIPKLKADGWCIIAVELTDASILLGDLEAYIMDKGKICFVLGNEDSGVNRTTLELCDTAVMIPMYGKNASLNVTVSAGIVLFGF